MVQVGNGGVQVAGSKGMHMHWAQNSSDSLKPPVPELIWLKLCLFQVTRGA